MDSKPSLICGSNNVSIPMLDTSDPPRYIGPRNCIEVQQNSTITTTSKNEVQNEDNKIKSVSPLIIALVSLVHAREGELWMIVYYEILTRFEKRWLIHV